MDVTFTISSFRFRASLYYRKDFVFLSILMIKILASTSYQSPILLYVSPFSIGMIMKKKV